MRTCNKCGISYPATPEYFYRNKMCQDGLTRICKKCRKEYDMQNKEVRAYYRKEYDAKNKDRFQARKRIQRAKVKDVKEKYRTEWRKNNPEKYKIYCQKRRAKKNLLLNTLTEAQWEFIKNSFNNQCAYCGKTAVLEQDHFIPLTERGEYTHNNIIPSCKSCNRSKGTSFFSGWYPQQEFYSKRREAKILKFLNYKNEIQQLSL